MRIPNAVGPAFIASAAIIVLIGCSGDISKTGPAPLALVPASGVQHSQPLGVRDAASRPLIFVADERHNDVNIYLQATGHKRVGQITGLDRPLGLATDTAGNVYIPYKQQVLVYAPPYKAVTLTLDDSGNFPYGVAVSTLGVVAAVNICSAPKCPLDSASVTFFAKNSTTACATVSDIANFSLLASGVFDDVGNLYVKGRDPSNADDIGEITGGCKATKISRLTTTNPMGGDGTIKIDKSDRIAILNEPTFNYFEIDSYHRPKNGSLGKPVSITPVPGLKGPMGFAFLASGANVYVADFLGAVVNEYDYPAGGSAESTVTVRNGLPSDVAVFPTLVP